MKSRLKLFGLGLVVLLLMARCNPESSHLDDQPDWLVELDETRRIGGGHFADFVIDDEGNSFVSCFSTRNSVDYISIFKVDYQGQKVWSIEPDEGQWNKGRALAIAKDNQNHVWVVGSFIEAVQIGGEVIMGSEVPSGFVAHLDTSGKCIDLINIGQRVVPNNVHINEMDEILIAGAFNDTISIGDVNYIQPKGHGAFVASLTREGVCQWVRSFEGNVGIERLRSDAMGDLFLAGSFHGMWGFQGDTLVTGNNFDSDGFLLKLNSDGQIAWVKQFGNYGSIRYGFRTGESVVDVVCTPDGEVIALVRLEEVGVDDETVSRVALIDLDTNGNEKKIKTLEGDGKSMIAFGLARTADRNLWLCGSAHNAEGESCFLFELDPDWKVKRAIHGPKDAHGRFRVANTVGNIAMFTGHFRGSFGVNELSISNKGDYGLFMYRTH